MAKTVSECGLWPRWKNGNKSARHETDKRLSLVTRAKWAE